MKTRDLAAWSLFGRPPALQKRILENEEFRSTINISPAAPYRGLQEFSFGEIAAAARRLFADSSPQKVTKPNGLEITVKLEGGRIVIEWIADTGTTYRFVPRELLCLAPDAETRLRGFNDLLAELGPTGPSAENWVPIIRERELTEFELERIHCWISN